MRNLIKIRSDLDESLERLINTLKNTIDSVESTLECHFGDKSKKILKHQ